MRAYNIFVMCKKVLAFSPVSTFYPYMHVISAGKTALFGWTVGWSPVTALLLLIKYYNISLYSQCFSLENVLQLCANSDKRA